jgi:O-antigen/teichoic acid export membrane protein
LSLIEVFPSLATETCNAKRHYSWSFVQANGRLVVLLAALVVLEKWKTASPAAGATIWIVCSLSAFLLSLWYLGGRHLLGWPLRLDADFIGLLRSRWSGLVIYRIGVLAFGAIPSFLIAYSPRAQDAGLFAFALTLSNFMYAGLAPVNEQVYSPSLSRLVHEKNAPLLRRRMAQMLSLTIFLTAIGSAVLLACGRGALVLIGKTQFLDSFSMLAPLLGYQALVMASATFTYPLFCSNRFTHLGTGYLAAAGSAAVWFLLSGGQVERAVFGLPIAAAVLLALSAGQFIYLWEDFS